MKKIYLVLAILFVALLAVFSLRFIIGGSEDTWICDNGEWVKHGVPSAPKPDKPCGGEKLIGGDRDEHGCLGPAGYQWCPSEKKCMRMWEEYCEEYKEQYRGDEEKDCQSYTPEDCPSDCVVCPPCMECSSISCQSEEFCSELGIGRDWYEGIKSRIDSFEKCVAAGNAVMESYPRKCQEGDTTFVEEIGNEVAMADKIVLNTPRPNQKVKSPLVIEGEARGIWYFEADFPVVLTNWDGLIIAEGYASAQGEWMTEDFVSFKAELAFVRPEVSDRGTLILQRDNPSGLPENDEALEIPVFFSD